MDTIREYRARSLKRCRPRYSFHHPEPGLGASFFAALLSVARNVRCGSEIYDVWKAKQLSFVGQIFSLHTSRHDATSR
jgi:hypothetical protein